MCNVCVWKVTENNLHSGRQGTTNIFLLTLLYYTVKPTVQYSLTAHQHTASFRNIMNLAQEGTKQVNEDVEFLVIGAGRKTENYIM